MRKLKRRCYYDHKNDRERHVWGRWYFRKYDKWRECKRCPLIQDVITDWPGLLFQSRSAKRARRAMIKSLSRPCSLYRALAAKEDG